MNGKHFVTFLVAFRPNMFVILIGLLQTKPVERCPSFGWFCACWILLDHWRSALFSNSRDWYSHFRRIFFNAARFWKFLWQSLLKIFVYFNTMHTSFMFLLIRLQSAFVCIIPSSSVSVRHCTLMYVFPLLKIQFFLTQLIPVFCS